MFSLLFSITCGKSEQQHFVKTSSVIMFYKLQFSIQKISWIFEIVVVVQLLSHGQFFVTPWTVTGHVPLSMEFYRQEILKCVAVSSSGVFHIQGWTRISCALHNVNWKGFTPLSTHALRVCMCVSGTVLYPSSLSKIIVIKRSQQDSAKQRGLLILINREQSMNI